MVSSFFLLSFLFCQISLLVSVTNLSSFKLQPTIQEHEDLVWLAGNLKLEVTNYLRDYTVLEEWPTQVMVVMMMMVERRT